MKCDAKIWSLKCNVYYFFQFMQRITFITKLEYHEKYRVPIANGELLTVASDLCNMLYVLLLLVLFSNEVITKLNNQQINVCCISKHDCRSAFGAFKLVKLLNECRWYLLTHSLIFSAICEVDIHVAEHQVFILKSLSHNCLNVSD